MMQRRLRELAERLLRSGVAPRHVRRLISELRDHYEDVVHALLARGERRADAERLAGERLGTDDGLAHSVLARPELRSVTARRPGLVLGAGPTLLWLGTVIATIVLVQVLSPASVQAAQPTWVLPLLHALCLAYTRALPVAVGVAALAAAARQRMRAHWAIAGAAVVNLLAGTIDVNVVPEVRLGDGGQLGVSSQLLPFLFPLFDWPGRKDLLGLAVGAGRALGMLTMTLTVYLAWRHRERALHDGSDA